MLKLMKYELKSTARIFIPFYIVLFIMAIINKLFFMLNSSYTTFFTFSKSFTVFAYVSIIICVFVLTFVVMLQRFYKNLLCDEGYLMHTLPIKPYKHIISKGIISIFWMLMSIIVTAASLLILAAGTGIIPSGLDFLNKIFNIFSSYESKLKNDIIIFFIQFVVFIIVLVITETLRFYSAMSLGQLFSRHKLLASFGAYIVLVMITQFINTIYAIIMFNNISIFDSNYIPVTPIFFSKIFLGVLTIITLIYGIGFYLTTHFIISKKLNLD